MKPLFRSPEHATQRSSFSENGEGRAVAPISALKLFRTGMKRRRGDLMPHGERDSNGEVNCDAKEENEKFPLSWSSSSLFCLVQNPFFTLPLGVTELAGPAGVGKTQIALSLCADCVQRHRNPQQIEQNNHNNNKAVYIQLGGSSRFLQIVSRRLQQMLQSRIAETTVPRNCNAASGSRQQDQSQHQDHCDEETVRDCLTRILVNWICNSEELMNLLRTILPQLLCVHPDISLVVLDGIATLFRLLPEQQQQQLLSNGDSNSNPWHDRAITFFQISNLCKELSSRFRVPFLVINECTSRIATETGQERYMGEKVVLEPALGLAWSQCVNCSFFVRRHSSRISSGNPTHSRRDENVEQSARNNIRRRRILQCLRAPHISSEHSVSEFWIDRSGVIPIRDSFPSFPTS